MPILPSKSRLGLILLLAGIFTVGASFYYNAALGAEPVMTYVGARNLNSFSQSSPSQESVETRSIKEVKEFDSMDKALSESLSTNATSSEDIDASPLI